MNAEEPRSILVIDDDPDVRFVIRTTLEEEGYTVNEVGDGWGAITAVQERRPDLAILDVMLPGIDGEAVATALRLMEGVPILVVTGRRDTSVVVQRLGGYAVLRKPFSIGDLVEAVEQGLRG
ncbi:MAG: response regulator [Chloroflexota bacterium]|nr:response regulator [Chloroflexota bacterium]